MNTQIKKLHHIKRPVQDEMLKQTKNLTAGQILLMHGDSGAGKTVILEHLHEQNGKGKFFYVEKYSFLKDPKAGFLGLLFENKMFDYKPDIRIHIEQTLNANVAEKVTDNHQEVNIRPGILSESQIASEILGAFGNYFEKFIYLDAIENILVDNDAGLFAEIIKRLQNNGVKIIITSRKDINPFNNVLLAKIEKFIFSEAQEYVKSNFPLLNSEQQDLLPKLVKFFDKENNERYDPIMLTLFYSLYTIDQKDLEYLINSLTNSKDASVFVYGNEHAGRHEFHKEVENLILQKLFHKDENLLEYFKKTFLLRYHEKNAEYFQDSLDDIVGKLQAGDQEKIEILKNPDSITDQSQVNSRSITTLEWNAFEKFASINGREVRNSITCQLQWNLHDSLYHLIAKYFLSELSHHPTEYEEASNQYYRIAKPLLN